MFEGYRSQTGHAVVDDLLSRGGMISMLNTVWLIICALGFGAVMEKTRLLERMIRSVLARAKSAGSLIAAAIATAFGTNVVAADQYMALVLPGRLYQPEFRRRGLAPVNLSRALEDGATITSPLVPWNTCGAYMAATLGVATLDYLPYAFFNLAGPLIAWRWPAGFRIVRSPPAAAAATATGPSAPARDADPLPPLRRLRPGPRPGPATPSREPGVRRRFRRTGNFRSRDVRTRCGPPARRRGNRHAGACSRPRPAGPEALAAWLSTHCCWWPRCW